MKTDAERIEALLDLVDPERSPNPGNGAKLQVLGLAERFAKGGYSPTRAGWALMGDKGRVYRPR